MKNIKLTYIPVKKSDIFEGLSFYDSLSESFTYTTDSNKWFFKDINIDNMESKIKDIMYNSLIKILFDKDKLPEPYIGTAASEENAKIDICNRFFKAYWNLVIWGGTQTGASVLKYIKEIIIPDTNLFIEELKRKEYKLPKNLSDRDIIVSKIKESKYEDFPDSIKEILIKLFPYLTNKENSTKKFWDGYYTLSYNPVELNNLDKIIGYTTRDKEGNGGFSKKLAYYFPNITQEILEKSVKDLVVPLLLDSQYYVFADEIIKNSKDKIKVKTPIKVPGTTGNEQKDSSSNNTAVKKREDKAVKTFLDLPHEEKLKRVRSLRRENNL